MYSTDEYFVQQISVSVFDGQICGLILLLWVVVPRVAVVVVVAKRCRPKKLVFWGLIKCYLTLKLGLPNSIEKKHSLKTDMNLKLAKELKFLLFVTK